MSVVEERFEYLVPGIERSYKWLEEHGEAPRKVMEEEPELRKKSLPSKSWPRKTEHEYKWDLRAPSTA